MPIFHPYFHISKAASPARWHAKQSGLPSKAACPARWHHQQDESTDICTYLCQVLPSPTAARYMQILTPSTTAFRPRPATRYMKVLMSPAQHHQQGGLEERHCIAPAWHHQQGGQVEERAVPVPLLKYFCQVFPPPTAAIYVQVLMPSTPAYHFSHLYGSTSAKYCRLQLQPFICQYLCQVLPPPTSAIYMPVLMQSTTA